MSLFSGVVSRAGPNSYPRTCYRGKNGNGCWLRNFADYSDFAGRSERQRSDSSNRFTANRIGLVAHELRGGASCVNREAGKHQLPFSLSQPTHEY